MKVEKGKYYRTNENEIIRNMYDDIKLPLVHKTADTPQELIMIGDLLLYKSQTEINKTCFRLVEDISVKNIYIGFFAIKSEDILEIWTKTDDDTYSCQWRKSNV